MRQLFRACLLALAVVLNLLDLAFAQYATMQGGKITLTLGPTQPQHEPLRVWVANKQKFRQHLAWLSSNLALPRDIPVLFQSCGTANAFYNPSFGSISICYEWITKRHDIVRANLPPLTSKKSAEEKISDAVIRSTLHVINHEVGHALLHLLDLPVLGREEDAADGFSAFILLERGTPEDAYSVLQGALSHGQRYFFENGDQADLHSLNDQRFYNLICWLLGKDPVRFAGYAQQARLPAFRQQSCTSEWAQMRASWLKVLGSRLRPATISETATLGVRVALVDNKTIRIPGGAEGGAWTFVFNIDRVDRIISGGVDPHPVGSMAFVVMGKTDECRAQLDVLGTDGGNRDVETMLFDKYNYLNWSNGSFTEPIFQSGRVRHLVTEVPIRGPGEFVLVVSNKFSSALTPKVVKVSFSVACP